jgi:hypothetical protein
MLPRSPRPRPGRLRSPIRGTTSGSLTRAISGGDLAVAAGLAGGRAT